MGEVCEVCGFVRGVAPEAWGLVTAALVRVRFGYDRGLAVESVLQYLCKKKA